MANDVEARSTGNSALAVGLVAIALVALIAGFLFLRPGADNPTSSTTIVENRDPAPSTTIVNPPAPSININPAPATGGSSAGSSAAGGSDAGGAAAAGSGSSE